jgi:hypothetical protein
MSQSAVARSRVHQIRRLGTRRRQNLIVKRNCGRDSDEVAHAEVFRKCLNPDMLITDAAMKRYTGSNQRLFVQFARA